MNAVFPGGETAFSFSGSRMGPIERPEMVDGLADSPPDQA